MEKFNYNNDFVIEKIKQQTLAETLKKTKEREANLPQLTESNHNNQLSHECGYQAGFTKATQDAKHKKETEIKDILQKINNQLTIQKDQQSNNFAQYERQVISLTFNIIKQVIYKQEIAEVLQGRILPIINKIINDIQQSSNLMLHLHPTMASTIKEYLGNNINIQSDESLTEFDVKINNNHLKIENIFKNTMNDIESIIDNIINNITAEKNDDPILSSSSQTSEP